MTVFQIYWQKVVDTGINDGELTELIDDRDVNDIDEMMDWIKEIRGRYPEGKADYQLMICNVSSPNFVSPLARVKMGREHD